ncbi:unnamed protein product [Acanthosepion pharaonis]|uniref:Uncharacterized protein n=1 Tax=Acanthosepion pharaonis TaxID=158019 RepID=A0A812CM05_ACAPH|nr:unnamed protein product [Sepia pharaonis]
MRPAVCLVTGAIYCRSGRANLCTLVNSTCTHSASPLVPVSSVFVNGSCTHSEQPFIQGFSAPVNGLDIFCVQPTVLASTTHRDISVVCQSSSAPYTQSNHPRRRLFFFPTPSNRHWRTSFFPAYSAYFSSNIDCSNYHLHMSTDWSYSSAHQTVPDIYFVCIYSSVRTSFFSRYLIHSLFCTGKFTRVLIKLSTQSTGSRVVLHPFHPNIVSSSSFSTLPSMRRTEMEAFPLPLYVHPTLGVKGLAPPLAPSVQAVPPSATFFDSALHPGPHVTPSAAAAAAAA